MHKLRILIPIFKGKSIEWGVGKREEADKEKEEEEEEEE